MTSPRRVVPEAKLIQTQSISNPPAQVAQNLKVPPSRAAASKRATLMVQLAKEMSMGVDPILQVCGAVYVDYNIYLYLYDNNIVVLGLLIY